MDPGLWTGEEAFIAARGQEVPQLFGGGGRQSPGQLPSGRQPEARSAKGQRSSLGGSYLAVAVVRSGSGLTLDNLRGSRSCHTGLNRTAGWNIPIGLLLDSGRMAAMGCDFPAAASAFFSASCVPGASGPGFPQSLCSLCKGDATGEGRCQSSPREDYFGYSGALRCLAEGAGDVAFIKHSTVQETLQGRTPPAAVWRGPRAGGWGGGCPLTFGVRGESPPPFWAKDFQMSDFQLLCRDGGRAPVEAWRDCHLARVPGHAVVTRPGTDRRLLLQVLQEGQPSKRKPDQASPSKVAHHAWLPTGPSEPPGTPGVSGWRQRVPCPPSGLTCIAFPRGRHQAEVPPGCVNILSGQSHGINGPFLKRKQKQGRGMKAALAKNRDTSSTYYAVAVVRRATADGNGSDAFTVHELRGRRSCHTGFGRRAGWTLPVGILLSKGLIQPRGCSVLEGQARVPLTPWHPQAPDLPACLSLFPAVSAFFSASCVPTDRSEGFPANLCGLCAGDEDGNHKCEASDRERYFGYTGAFRCLAEGRGEVAFVKHTSVFENTDGRNAVPWASQLHSADFQLLCPNGARAEVGQFAECHWGQVPPRAIMVHPETNPLAVYGLLDRAQDFFGANNNSNGFKMFSSSDFHGQDLIFKDATTAIVPAEERTTADAWLGQMFLEALEGWESSSSSSSSSPQCSGAGEPPAQH
ncbi:hypothetical protein JD844_008017 [Phrynosoma platyrhinos]|uniref:Transferrin-like domain-containing protein n=1 Tax=Phrynosoma platyrhinos TaxID=52577 RepID=A0ABQ7T442_PHRPL|nr:hypothetical protein JD844_008017 [Phrynosoma platyrhinos]